MPGHGSRTASSGSSGRSAEEKGLFCSSSDPSELVFQQLWALVLPTAVWQGA